MLMNRNTQEELLSASDAVIDDAVQYADPMVLRGLLYQLTGDEAVANVSVGKHIISGHREYYYVEKPEDVKMIREKAAQLLKAHRDAGGGAFPLGPESRLLKSLSLTGGAPVPATEFEMWFETTGLKPMARGLTWSGGKRPESASDFNVIVIGSGMSGLNVAVHLKNAGIPYTVLEKGYEVGGTWRDNRYPGARLDTPSRVYTHTYGVGFPYPYQFSPQVENEKYFNWVADKFGLRDSIEFGTEVVSAVWDEAASEWVVTIRKNGREQARRANAVITGVGFLSQPNLPKIEGMGDFKGRMFHTAQWPEDLDHAGKRVAVIGTGATGYQMVPELARTTGHLTVFQRTPNWLFEVPGYLEPLPEQSGWIDRNFPYFPNFARFHTAYGSRTEITRAGNTIDPDYKDEYAVSAINKVIRDQRIAFLESKLGDRPDLLRKMIPVAPPMSARPIIVDTEYSFLDVIKRDDVDLVSEGIRRITSNGIETVDGVLHEVDIIVLATGFKANDYLYPMEIRGRDDLDINEYWAKDGARAYLGSMVPKFPNLFMLYGPNTNLPLGLQITDLIELTGLFAIENIGGLIEKGKRSVEVTEDAYWRYNGLLDEAEKLMIYSDPRSNNYYKNAFGRGGTNCPLEAALMWNWTRDPVGRRPAPEGVNLAEHLSKKYRVLAPRQDADLVVR